LSGCGRYEENFGLLHVFSASLRAPLIRFNESCLLLSIY
jgi:hypothetical protein